MNSHSSNRHTHTDRQTDTGFYNIDTGYIQTCCHENIYKDISTSLNSVNHS